MTEEVTTSSVKETKKLNELEEISTVPLLTIQTVFPFRLFPAILTLDRMKLAVVDHYFFGAKQVKTLIIKDIHSVEVQNNIFFAALLITSVPPQSRITKIEFLLRDDASKMQRMIEGLLITAKENVDVLKVEHHALTNKLEEIGNVEA